MSSFDCWGGWQALFIYISYDFYRLFSLDLRWSELASVHKLLTVDVSYNAMDEDELTQLTKSYCRPRVKLCLEGTRMPKTYWPIFFWRTWPHIGTSQQKGFFLEGNQISWNRLKQNDLSENPSGNHPLPPFPGTLLTSIDKTTRQAVEHQFCLAVARGYNNITFHLMQSMNKKEPNTS